MNNLVVNDSDETNIDLEIFLLSEESIQETEIEAVKHETVKHETVEEETSGESNFRVIGENV